MWARKQLKNPWTFNFIDFYLYTYTKMHTPTPMSWGWGGSLEEQKH